MHIMLNGAPRSFAKVGESAITVRELAKDLYIEGNLTADLIDAKNAEWKAALTASPEGCYFWALRLQERFMVSYEKQRIARKGKVPVLRTVAQSFREARPEEAFMLCTWWAKNEEVLQAHIASATRYEELKGMFLRGTAITYCLLSVCACIHCRCHAQRTDMMSQDP